MKPTRIITAALLITLSVPASTLAAGDQKLYRWVDDDGNVHYSDTVPPEASRKERRVLDEQGMTVDKLERAKTPEEVAAQERRQKLREQRRREAERQAAQDRVLLNTYESEQDIISLRDSKLQTVENIIQISKRRRNNLRERLNSLMHRAADRERAGKEVPKGLEQRIASTRKQIREASDFIERKHQEQKEIREDYEKDIQRYRELKERMQEGSGG